MKSLYNAADNMKARNNILALKAALTLRGIQNYHNQLIHHSDRGGQYIYQAYLELLDKYTIQVSMCSDVLENAHIERVNGTIKNEYLNRRKINSLSQLKYWLQKDVDAYNNRVHNSLIIDSKKRTPIEFENFIKELSKREKPVLKVFTISKQISETPNQLSLFEG